VLVDYAVTGYFIILGVSLLSYAEGEMPRPMPVTLSLALFSKLLTQLANDARLTLCILGVTAVRNFFKMTTSFIALVLSDFGD
jgi:hypothetical protein